MKCCCATCAIVLILILALIGAVLFVITPNMIGVGDVPMEFMGDKSLNDLGLGDSTLWNIIQELTNLMMPADRDKVLTNAHSEEDLEQATEKLDLAKNEEGKIDYSQVMKNGLNQTEEPVEITDKELGALLNGALKDSANSFGEDNTELAAVTDKVALEEVEIKKNDDGSTSIKMTLGVDMLDLIDTLGSEGGSGSSGGGSSAIPEEVKSLLKEGTTFLTQEIKVTQNEITGEYELDAEKMVNDLLINGKESPVIMGLLTTIGAEAGVSGTVDMLKEVQTIFGSIICTGLNAFGITGLGSGSAIVSPLG